MGIRECAVLIRKLQQLPQNKESVNLTMNFEYNVSTISCIKKPSKVANTSNICQVFMLGTRERFACNRNLISQIEDSNKLAEANTQDLFLLTNQEFKAKGILSK